MGLELKKEIPWYIYKDLSGGSTVYPVYLSANSFFHTSLRVDSIRTHLWLIL